MIANFPPLRKVLLKPAGFRPHNSGGRWPRAAFLLVLFQCFMMAASGQQGGQVSNQDSVGSRPMPNDSPMPEAPLAQVFNTQRESLPNSSADMSADKQDARNSAASAPQSSSSAQLSERIPQTRRILGIIPNFRAISTDEKLPPQSAKEKFVTATEDSFDYSSVFIPALLAGYSKITNATPEFGTGVAAYGRYFWHSAVDQTSENYLVEFVVPTLTREDTRYYTLGRGSFLKRAGYALSRAVVTRSDSGREVFNLSEVVGAGAAAGLSNLYYPSPERTVGNTGKQWGLDVAIDGASFAAKEFWPDINHWLTRSKKTSLSQ